MSPLQNTTPVPAFPEALTKDSLVEKTYTYGDYLQEEKDARTRRLVMYFQIGAAGAAVLYYFITIMTRRNG